jgi:hypothetical protein
MKNLLLPVIIAGVLALTVTGCQKTASKSTTPKASALTLSKTSVARGEQLTASVQGLSASAVIKWSVFPTPGTKLLSGKDQATAFFGNQGRYQLTANIYADSTAPAPYDSTSSPVTVSDSVYTPPPPVQSDTSALAGNSIQIEPITATDTGGLIMIAQTSKLYSCYPQLNYYFSQQGNTIELDFQSVSSTIAACNGVTNTAKAFIMAQPPPNGVYTFNVVLNTAVYSGTLTVTDQNYTFNWPYTSGVTISPLQIASK